MTCGCLRRATLHRRAAYSAQPLEVCSSALAWDPTTTCSRCCARSCRARAGVLIDCPRCMRAPPSTQRSDEHLRFLGFTRAALAAASASLGAAGSALQRLAHAFAPLFLKTVWEDEPLFAATRTVLTIHNIGYQGIFPRPDCRSRAAGRRKLLHQDDLAAGGSTPCATASCTPTPSPRSADSRTRDLHR